MREKVEVDFLSDKEHWPNQRQKVGVEGFLNNLIIINLQLLQASFVYTAVQFGFTKHCGVHGGVSCGAAEKDREVFRNVDPLVVYVAAMVHDIGDGKYLSDELVKMETDEADQEQQRDFIESFIRQSAPECPPYIWGPASHVAALVSFTREIRNPVMVAQQCAAYPALQLVQDADRLDGLGAVGIVRGAVYGGVTEPRGTGTVRRVVHIADERHSRYPEMMKTRAGKKEAAKRWEAMKEIRNQIVQQANCEDVLEEY